MKIVVIRSAGEERVSLLKLEISDKCIDIGGYRNGHRKTGNIKLNNLLLPV